MTEQQTDYAAREDQVQQWRDTAATRPEQPADAICEAVGLAVSDALADGAMSDHLRSRGWVLVHVGDDPAVPPEAPAGWMQDALDIAEPGWIDALGRLDEIWRQAWNAGYLAGRAGDQQ